MSSKGKKSGVNRVRGMRDWIGNEMAELDALVDTLSNVVNRHGFSHIQTPLVEHTDLFCRSLGDGSDIVMKEMYTFEDNSSNSLSLRPEGTAGVIRALISNSMMYALPHKLFYAGPMYRYERPQRGRYREFQQFGVEYVGSKGPSVDVEVISMAAQCLSEIGAAGRVRLELNTLGDSESRKKYRSTLQQYLENYKSELSSDSQLRLERGSVLRILDSKSGADQEIIRNAPPLSESLSPDAAERFDSVLKGLDALRIPYEVNPSLVRGLDYYSHTVFEFIEKPASGGDNAVGVAVLAGGCYDGLVDMLGGPPTPCIGWAAGLDRLCLVREHTPTQRCEIAMVPVTIGDDDDQVIHSSLRLAQVLRASGNIVHMCHDRGNLKKQMKFADRLGCSHAVIIGVDEVRVNQVRIKDMSTREERVLSVDGLDNVDFK